MIATLTLKQIAANKLRLLATAFAIVLGVAFLAGTLILTDTITGTLNHALADADAGTDAYIRGSSALPLGYGDSGPALDATLINTIRRTRGVNQASIEVVGYAQILDQAGKAVGNVDTGVLGRNWVTVPELNPFTISSGHPPTGPNEIAIDKHSADTAHFHIGDHTTVLSTGKPRPATIVGIVKFGSLDTPGAISVILFDDITAQAVLNAPGKIDAISVTAFDGVSPDTLVKRLTPVVGASNEVISGATLTAQHQRQIGKDIGQFGTFLTIFALISLFVGAFIINNTFSIIVSQRTKGMALLRAVGATGRQVRAAVLAEAAVTGLVASAVGLVAGIGIAKGIQSLLRALGVDIPLGHTVLTPATAAISILVGFVITVGSAVLPARRASKVPPIAALREVAQDRSGVSKRRLLAGTALTALAIAVLLVGLGQADAKIVGAGAVAIFLGVAVLGPVLARPVSAILGTPIAKLRGTAGVIARQNAVRNPTRTARTASSLMIGVALVSFLTIFAASIKSSGAEAFRKDFRGNLIVDSGSVNNKGGFSPDLAAHLATRKGVRTISEQRNVVVEINGNPGVLSAFDATTIDTLFHFGRITGHFNQLADDGIAVEAETGPNPVALGDNRTVTFASGPATFTVKAIYEHRPAFVGNQFVDLRALEANVPVSIDSRIFVTADSATVIDAAAAYPTAKVLTITEFIARQNGTIDTILALVYALLGLAVFIALLGIANTLALSIHERKRELGLLRAVGMSRAQVRSSVRWEAAIIAVFGTLLGLGIGTFLGWTMVRALADQGISHLVIPITLLVIVAAIAAIAAIAASVLPARRAARIDVLTAVATG